MHRGVQHKTVERADIPAADHRHRHRVDMVDDAALRQPDVAIDGRLVLESVEEATTDITTEQTLLDRQGLGMTGRTGPCCIR